MKTLNCNKFDGLRLKLLTVRESNPGLNLKYRLEIRDLDQELRMSLGELSIGMASSIRFENLGLRIRFDLRDKKMN